MRALLAAVVAIAVAAGGVTLALGAASPNPQNRLRVQATIYDPDATGCPTAATWNSGYGVDGGIGLLLSNQCTDVTTTNGASADATFRPTDGLRLRGTYQGGISAYSGLGFYVLNTTHCTGGSPRFDVELANGGVYAFGCSAGVHEATSSPNWDRVWFRDTDVQNLSGPTWPNCFTTNTSACDLTFLQVLADEGPVNYPSTDTGVSTQLDNIRVVLSGSNLGLATYVNGKPGMLEPCGACSF